MIIADNENFRRWLNEAASTLAKLFAELAKCESIPIETQTFVLYYFHSVRNGTIWKWPRLFISFFRIGGRGYNEPAVCAYSH